MHKEDCQTLSLGSIHEIVSVRWALNYWNQKINNSNSKLGFFAGDSCSRPKEAILQTLRFLDYVGYHEPMECVNQTKNHERKLPTLIGNLNFIFLTL